MQTDFRQVAIIGLGFMGGSFGKALQTVNPELEVATYDPSGAALEGMTAYESLETTVAQADFIILATPLSAYEAILKTAAPHMKPGALVMDLGSVKSGIEDLFSRCLSPHRQLHWVGGHPMCGSDKTGAAHADGNLFQGASFFLTGHLAAPQAEKLERLLVQIGARPIWVSEAHHDTQVAVTSHLPHLSAAALMHCAAVQSEATDFMAGGFRDATRVASGSEQIWKDILLWNRKEVLVAIERYQHQLETLTLLLTHEDAAGLEAYLKTARQLKINPVETERGGVSHAIH